MRNRRVCLQFRLWVDFGVIGCVLLGWLVGVSSKSVAAEVGYPVSGSFRFQEAEPSESQGDELTLEISGTVLDAMGRPVRDSIVTPLTKYGAPIAKCDGKPLTAKSFQEMQEQDFFVSSVTNAEGQFTLQIPPGDYRLIALSWMDHPSAKVVLAKNGKRVRLDGIADNLRFRDGMDAAIPVPIRPIGNSELTLSTTTSGTYLFFSTGSLAGDPALGFTAWAKEFPRGLIGATRIQGKQMTISGLPAGQVQFAAFANDNNPGFGGVSVTLAENDYREVRLPIIASWSDGHKKPPSRLEKLVAQMKENREDRNVVKAYVTSKMTDENGEKTQGNFLELSFKLAQYLDDEIELSDGSVRSFGDCLAALSYMRLNR